MKKILAFSILIISLSFGVNKIFAEDSIQESNVPQETQTEEIMNDTDSNESANEITESKSFHQVIKQKFIEGGPSFMGIVLICLILGLALCIERIIYLNKATTNT